MPVHPVIINNISNINTMLVAVSGVANVHTRPPFNSLLVPRTATFPMPL